MEQSRTKGADTSTDFLNKTMISNGDDLLELNGDPDFMKKYNTLVEIFKKMIYEEIEPKNAGITRRLENIIAETSGIVELCIYLKNIDAYIIDTFRKNILTIIKLIDSGSDEIVNKLNNIVPNTSDPIKVHHETLLKPIFDVFGPKKTTNITIN